MINDSCSVLCCWLLKEFQEYWNISQDRTLIIIYLIITSAMATSTHHFDLEKDRYLGNKDLLIYAKNALQKSVRSYSKVICMTRYFSKLYIFAQDAPAAKFLPSLNWMIFSSNWEKWFLTASGRNERNENETIHCNYSHTIIQLIKYIKIVILF